MKRINKLKLSREAMLFDSPLYLLKAFLGVMVSYLAFSHHTIVGKDMISVLFGMMLSLEPVNITGLKSGIAQFQATLLGGMVTAVIIMVGGVNMITVPLAVMATLYICILLDWRNISPVASFTSIYMTQYIQFTSMGQPSMWLTFRLRIVALGAGVIVAIFLNFLFSLLFYKLMVRKRTIYLLENQLQHMVAYRQAMIAKDSRFLNVLKHKVTGLFGDIDFIYGHVMDLNKEKGGSRNLSAYLTIIEEIRLLNHYFYDMLLETVDLEGDTSKIAQTVGQMEEALKEIVTLEKCHLPLVVDTQNKAYVEKLVTSLGRLRQAVNSL